MRIASRQNAVHFATWIVSAAVFAAVNLAAGPALAYVTGAMLLFGGIGTACMGHLVTHPDDLDDVADKMNDLVAGCAQMCPQRKTGQSENAL